MRIKENDAVFKWGLYESLPLLVFMTLEVEFFNKMWCTVISYILCFLFPDFEVCKKGVLLEGWAITSGLEVAHAISCSSILKLHLLLS